MTLPKRFPTMAEFAVAFPERAELLRANDRAREPYRDRPDMATVEAVDPTKAEKIRKRERTKRQRLRDKYRSSNLARYLWLSVRGEAKRKGVGFDLTEEWFAERLKAGVCEMSGLPFNFEGGGRSRGKENVPSVDRKIAGGHYLQVNCRLILFSLNQAMSNYGEDYIVNVFRQVIARREG